MTAGMVQLPLPEASGGRPLLPPGRDLPAWHAALTAEIATALSPTHAAILATPMPGAGGVAWFAHGGAVRRFADLSAEDRRALTAAAGAILSDIRRLAESQAALTVSTAWPALREVPDIAHLFAVDGRPVLAGWGFGPASGMAGPMTRLDDGVPFRPPLRTPWGVHATCVAVLALLGLGAGLLLPLVGALVTPAPPSCQAAPGQTALMLEQARENERTNALRQERARLDEAFGRKQLACPIRRAPTPVPAPAPARRGDLPEERWDRHDLSMLEGCWNRVSNMDTREDSPPFQIYRLREWKMCFDRNGAGRQTLIWSDDRRCENDLRAQFNSDQSMTIIDLQKCSGGRNLNRGTASCRRISDNEADCPRTVAEGPGAGTVSSGRFRR